MTQRVAARGECTICADVLHSAYVNSSFGLSARRLSLTGDLWAILCDRMYLRLVNVYRRRPPENRFPRPPCTPTVRALFDVTRGRLAGRRCCGCCRLAISINRNRVTVQRELERRTCEGMGLLAAAGVGGGVCYGWGLDSSGAVLGGLRIGTAQRCVATR